MASCAAGVCGGPLVWPSGASWNAALGGLADAVIDHAELRLVVTNPIDSR